MPLCRVGTPGCGCKKKTHRQVEVCLTVAIPDANGKPIAYESCRMKCVRASQGANNVRAGGPPYPYHTVMYPGGPVYIQSNAEDEDNDNVQ